MKVFLVNAFTFNGFEIVKSVYSEHLIVLKEVISLQIEQIFPSHDELSLETDQRGHIFVVFSEMVK